ncbi:DUF4158 domain-containing protein [Enterococcus faecalis]|uniref:DUF4158 domain-containing protein n=1 Tax=Enterococcus faecalis TaxID=1351 RepID=UPI0021F0BC7F|nr:DUF4158 domain-containing protein [Enterococcus faecalis]
MRLSSTKLGFSLQLSSLRFLGTFCTDINTIPENAIIYVAAQLKINPKRYIIIKGDKQKMIMSS